MINLAINGGKKVRDIPFPSQYNYNTNAIDKRIKSILSKTKIQSGFRGNWIPSFWGGEMVQEFENASQNFFDRKSLAVNSATSGLWIACGAIGLKPGDEVIVTPWSMSCSATMPILWGATPVFADIDPNNFCIDPVDVAAKITPKTKAIIVVDLFGQPANWEALKAIARDNNLFLIEDAAQALYAKSNHEQSEIPGRGGQYCGCFGDIGVFSFTQGKHVTCGEGGLVLCKNEELYLRCALLRNHSEAVISGMPNALEKQLFPNSVSEIAQVGMNLRMTEMQAAILLEELVPDWKKIAEAEKLDTGFPLSDLKYLAHRMYNGAELLDKLTTIPFIKAYPTNSYTAVHSLYVLPLKYEGNHPGTKGITRDKYLEAVKAELVGEENRADRGIPIGGGYIKPLYLMPLFKDKRHWALKDGTYHQGICPVAERLWQEEFFLTLYHGLPLSEKDRADIVTAFSKVADNMGEIK